LLEFTGFVGPGFWGQQIKYLSILILHRIIRQIKAIVKLKYEDQSFSPWN
jgi:hypothetical protein